MILYEVNLEVDPEIAPAFEAWLAEHARAVCQAPGFERADIHRVELLGHEPADDEPVRLTVWYRLQTRAALEHYLTDPGPHGASAMRADGLARFPGRFRATRRVLAPV